MPRRKTHRPPGMKEVLEALNTILEAVGPDEDEDADADADGEDPRSSTLDLLSDAGAEAVRAQEISGLPKPGHVWLLEVDAEHHGRKVTLVRYGGLRRYGLKAAHVRAALEDCLGIPVMATLNNELGLCRLDIRNRTDDGPPTPPTLQ